MIKAEKILALFNKSVFQVGVSFVFVKEDNTENNW